MKNLTKVLAIASIFITGSTASFAQASATASASATIITPITITKTADMNFGNVAVQASTGGTVIMNPAGVRTPATRSRRCMHRIDYMRSYQYQ